MRAKPVGRVQEVGGDLPGAADQVVLDGHAVHDQAQRGAHRLVGEQGMRRLETRALAIHLAPGIGLVALDEAHRAARDRHHPALAALLDAPQHLLLDQHVIREIVLTGL